MSNVEAEGIDIDYPALDAGNFLLGHPNFELQFAAIVGLLSLTHKADGELADKMQEIDRLARTAHGALNEFYVDRFGEHFYESVYQDAAHSMAAVGTLLP